MQTAEMPPLDRISMVSRGKKGNCTSTVFLKW